MDFRRVDRRTVLKMAAALAAAGPATGRVFAQGGAGASRSVKSLPARGEFVIRGATVLSMDAKVGDFERGDVHVRDGAIVAVGQSLSAAGVAAIDGRGMICMPGFIDTHWHLWTTVCRPMIRIDDPKRSYFPATVALGRHFTAEDSYRSVRLGLAEALFAGATTVHNWSHNVPTPGHADSELRAMRDCGIRGRYSYGQFQGMPDEQPMNYDDVAKVKRDWMPNDMLTLGMCSRNIGGGLAALRGSISIDMVRKDWGGARALGLPITLHTSGPSPIKALDEAKLLGPDVQLVHALLTTAEERQTLRERGVSYSIAPIGESRRPASAGVIQFGELLESGVKVSLSIDTTGTYDCNYFEAMRLLYNLHQHRIGPRVPVTAKRLLHLATIDGAVDLGIADRTGSLTPGKRADLILVRTGDVNIAPAGGDPYEALMSFAQPRNIDTVIVDGRILRRTGEFTALDYADVLKQATETAAALRARANWT